MRAASTCIQDSWDPEEFTGDRLVTRVHHPRRDPERLAEIGLPCAIDLTGVGRCGHLERGAEHRRAMHRRAMQRRAMQRRAMRRVPFGAPAVPATVRLTARWHRRTSS